MACCYNKSVALRSKYPYTVTSESSGHSRIAAFYLWEQINKVHENKNSTVTTKQSHSLERRNGSLVSL